MTGFQTGLKSSSKLSAIATLANKGKYKEAESLLQEIIKDDPNDHEAFATLGAIAIAQEDGRRGLEIYSRLVEVHPNRWEYWSGLAHANRLTGNLKEATEDQKKAVDISGGTAHTRAFYAELLLSENKLEQAAKEAELALAVDPEYYEANMISGLCAVTNMDFESALKHFIKANKIKPEEPEPIHNIGDCYAGLDNVEIALEYAERAYLIEPSNPTIILGYGRRLYENRNFVKAAEFAEKAVGMAPQNMIAHELRARCRMRTGQLSKGISDFAAVVAKDKNSRGIFMLSQMMRECGRVQEAMNISKEWLKNNPEDYSILSMYLDCAMTLGDFDAVREVGNAEIPPVTSLYVDDKELKDTKAGPLLLAARFLAKDDGTSKTIYAEGEIATLLSTVINVDLRPLVEKPDDASPLSNLTPIAIKELGIQLPNSPYLRPDPKSLAVWSAALSDHMRPAVGILWHGQNGGIKPEQLATALAGLATPVSLAVGQEIRKDLQGYTQILDAGVHIHSPADLVSAVASLDAVVVIDALSAYIAGALGKPGIVVLSSNKHWVWGERDGKLIWFPSLKAVSLPFESSWEDIVPDIRNKLREVLAELSSEKPNL